MRMVVQYTLTITAQHNLLIVILTIIALPTTAALFLVIGIPSPIFIIVHFGKMLQELEEVFGLGIQYYGIAFCGAMSIGLAVMTKLSPQSTQVLRM